MMSETIAAGMCCKAVYIFTALFLTTEDAGSKHATGDPEVMCVFLRMELVHVQVPQTKVSVGGAGNEHPTARAEGASYHCCVTHCPGPSKKKKKKKKKKNSNCMISFLFIIVQAHREVLEP